MVARAGMNPMEVWQAEGWRVAARPVLLRSQPLSWHSRSCCRPAARHVRCPDMPSGYRSSRHRPRCVPRSGYRERSYVHPASPAIDRDRLVIRCPVRTGHGHSGPVWRVRDSRDRHWPGQDWSAIRCSGRSWPARDASDLGLPALHRETDSTHRQRPYLGELGELPECEPSSSCSDEIRTDSEELAHRKYGPSCRRRCS